MPAFNTIIASFVCLAATVSALPTGPSRLSTRQPWSDCPKGTTFYTCFNGYKGCFDTDPCALPPKTFVDIPAPSTTSSSCPTGTGAVEVFEPALYDLVPSSPDAIAQPRNTIELEVKDNQQIKQQVAVWKGIPASAKQCVLHWGQATRSERNFVVDGTGFTRATQLTSLPEHGFSFNSVAKIADGKRSSPDFTFWDRDGAARKHTAGEIDCAEVIAIKFEMQTINGPTGKVVLDQDNKNGWFLSYTC